MDEKEREALRKWKHPIPPPSVPIIHILGEPRRALMRVWMVWRRYDAPEMIDRLLGIYAARRDAEIRAQEDVTEIEKDGCRDHTERVRTPAGLVFRVGDSLEIRVEEEEVQP